MYSCEVGREGTVLKSLLQAVLYGQDRSQGCPEIQDGLSSVQSVKELLFTFCLWPLPTLYPQSWVTLVPLPLVLFFLTAEVLAPDLSGSSLVI